MPVVVAVVPPLTAIPGLPAGTRRSHLTWTLRLQLTWTRSSAKALRTAFAEGAGALHAAAGPLHPASAAAARGGMSAARGAAASAPAAASASRFSINGAGPD